MLVHMQFGGIIHFALLMMTATIVHLETSLDKTIFQCVCESKRFARTEKKYVDMHTYDPNEPHMDPLQSEELQEVVYEKEKRQRPFECITDRTDDNSTTDLMVNPNYQALVRQCKSKQSQPLCDPSYPYRTYDGTCNNLKNPKYGSVLNCLKRIMEPNYRGAAGFRQSVCGKKLPKPRFLSLNIHKDVDKPDPGVTLLTTFFGQYLAHDITDVPLTFIDGKPINCCHNTKCDLHPQCAPIYIKKNDTFYSKHNITCLNWNRAALCDTCSIGKRIQMNQQTSFLDLSLIYSLSESSCNELRAKDGSGKLKTQKNKEYGNLMPCPKGEKYNFESGDRRVNQHTTLICLHTLFVLEHNRIAEELGNINPHWDEEKLFQEARKINIAQYQSIVYKEYLPVIVGHNLMALYDLWINTQGTTVYDQDVDATLYAEFNAAAYRLHSTTSKIMNNYECDKKKYMFLNTSRDPMPLYHNKMSSFMHDVCMSPAQKYTRFVPIDLTNYMYKEVIGSFGLDIASFNIQRGRDIGLPTYTQMVYYLSKGTIDIQSFDDLEDFMDKENINILRCTYCDVRDIDLWVGMTNEKVKENCLVAPTAAKIIALQFKELKFGDRFFFQHFGNFYKKQLQVLKKVTLSDVLCRNTGIKEIQLNAFLLPSETNPVTQCRDIRKLDFSFWEED